LPHVCSLRIREDCDSRKLNGLAGMKKPGLLDPGSVPSLARLVRYNNISGCDLRWVRDQGS
jgi:hypothetical protein